MLNLALYQPDQAGNVGTLLRLGACLAVPVHIIHPCGFSFSEKAFRRSAMDYPQFARLNEHDDYSCFKNKTSQQRIILLTTKANTHYTDFTFKPNDILMLGQESAGVPDAIHQEINNKVKIPMIYNARSLNIAIAAGMILGEALRQTDSFPK